MGKYTEEQIAAQEEKNNNDFVYRTNQEIQNIWNKIDSLELLFQKHLASHGSEISQFQAALDNHQSEMRDYLKLCNTNFDDFQKRLASHVNDVLVCFEQVQNEFVSKTEINPKLHSFKEVLSSLETSNRMCNDNIRSLLQRFPALVDEKVGSLRDELNSRPSNESAIRQELNQTLDVVGMDVTNASIRCANNEKQLNLIEKKIEQLFLLIKKLELK